MSIFERIAARMSSMLLRPSGPFVIAEPPCPLDRCSRCAHYHAEHDLDAGLFICPNSRGRWQFEPVKTAEWRRA